MKLQINTSIEIPADESKIWKVLTQWESHDQWNPLLKEIQGDFLVGNKVQLKVNNMSFRPMILAYKENEKLEWIGSFISKFVFAGQHSFQIEKIGANRCIFHQQETFSGLLLPLLKRGLKKDMPLLFNAMNEALKAQCL